MYHNQLKFDDRNPLQRAKDGTIDAIKTLFIFSVGVGTIVLVILSAIAPVVLTYSVVHYLFTH